MFRIITGPSDMSGLMKSRRRVNANVGLPHDGRGLAVTFHLLVGIEVGCTIASVIFNIKAVAGTYHATSLLFIRVLQYLHV
jgi:hypothetical protein